MYCVCCLCIGWWQSSVIEMLLDDGAVESEEIVSEIYASSTTDSTQPDSVGIYWSVLQS